MRKLFAFTSLLSSLLATAALLPAASAGTLTLNSGTSTTTVTDVVNFNGSTLNLSGSNIYAGYAVANTDTLALGTVSTAKAPELSGSAGDLKLTLLNDGNSIRLKTTVSISNTGTKAAKGVTATVYVSSDDLLGSDDLKVKTIKLSDYLPGVTKLLKGQTLSMPVKYKVPTAIASYLEGKYLIAVLSYEVAPGAQSITMLTSAGYTVTNGTLIDLNGVSQPVFFSNSAVPAAASKNIVVIGPIHLPTND